MGSSLTAWKNAGVMDGFDIYYEPDLPVFNSKIELLNFVDDIQSAIKPSRGKIRRGKKIGTPQK